MESLLGKNWRTSLAGLIEGAIPIGWAILDAINSGALNGKHGGALVLGIAMIIKGFVAKDGNVTGGTIQQ